MDMVWKERFRTSASKASMNFLRWASKERTQRIRPAASGKFLMWKVNGVLCLIRIQSIGSELSESPKHLFNVKEENWTALGTGGSPRCHLKQRIESNCSEDLFWTEQNSKTVTQKNGTNLGTGDSPCCRLKNFVILFTSFTGSQSSSSKSRGFKATVLSWEKIQNIQNTDTTKLNQPCDRK